VKDSTWELLEKSYELALNADGTWRLRANEVPSDEEIKAAMEELQCRFADDYIEFLRRYGGGMAYSLPIYGLRPVESMGWPWSVLEETHGIRRRGWPPAQGWYVISDDGYGNPIAMNEKDEVWINEYQFGGETKIYDSFEEFLLDFCLDDDLSE
jgi:hypothetical protein